MSGLIYVPGLKLAQKKCIPGIYQYNAGGVVVVFFCVFLGGGGGGEGGVNQYCIKIGVYDFKW